MTRGTLRTTLSTGLFALALALSGCLKVADEAVVTADGSGTFTESMVVDLTAMKQLGDMFKGMGGPGEHGPGMEAPGMEEPGMDGEGVMPKEDPVAKLKGEWKDIPGVELTKATSEEKDGKVSVHIEAKFATIEAYARASQIESTCDLVKNADGSYTLKFTSDNPMPGADKPEPVVGDGEKPAGMEGEKPDGDPMGGMGAFLMPMLEKSLAGLEFSRKLTLPGKIVETNGTKGDDGSTVSWKVTFTDMKKGKQEAQTVTFKGDGIDLKPFHVKRKAKEMSMGGGMQPHGPGAPHHTDEPDAPMPK